MPLLFDLEVDPSEAFNLATHHPMVVSTLLKSVEAHRSTVSSVKSQLEEVVP